LTATERENVFPPGHFFYFVNKPDAIDERVPWAPGSRRIVTFAEGTSRGTLIETGISVSLEVELISEQSGARRGLKDLGMSHRFNAIYHQLKSLS